MGNNVLFSNWADVFELSCCSSLQKYTETTSLLACMGQRLVLLLHAHCLLKKEKFESLRVLRYDPDLSRLILIYPCNLSCGTYLCAQIYYQEFKDKSVHILSLSLLICVYPMWSDFLPTTILQ